MSLYAPWKPVVVKYSPDQQRDSHGRFEDGGSNFVATAGVQWQGDDKPEYESKLFTHTSNQQLLEARNAYVWQNEETLKMNNDLRLGEEPSQRAKEIQKWALSGEAKVDTQVFRGSILSEQTIKSLKIGSSFTDLAFQSTAVTRGGAELYARDRSKDIEGEIVIFKLDVSAKTKCGDTGNSEIVFPMGSTVTITGITKEPGIRLVTDGNIVREKKTNYIIVSGTITN